MQDKVMKTASHVPRANVLGVGVAAIQLAKRAGATVIATASSVGRLDPLRALGLDQRFEYTSSLQHGRELALEAAANGEVSLTGAWSRVFFCAGPGLDRGNGDER